MREPTLAQLRAFMIAAQRGSVSAAAIELDLTQSAVSHAIHSLETQLGTVLLERHGRGVHPTEVGTRLLPLVEQLAALMHVIVTTASTTSPLEGTVSIAAFSSLARHLLPQALTRLALEHPALTIVASDHYPERHSVIRAVQQGQADIGLTQLLPGMNLVAQKLGEDPYVIVAPEHWALQDLFKRPYIHLGPPHDVWLLDALARHGVLLKPVLHLSTEAALLALVLTGLGYTILPQLTLPELPPALKVHPLPHPVKRIYGMVTKADAMAPGIRAVMAVLGQIPGHPD
ncbi:LysR family transcriptional regulator [Deinococcus sonorensis]|uniref:LysR family transcriptional regulator n=2 Tax=Deinococcus sonorensis TaxID=309891 RepID=A0AAU7U5A3_9DEIO